MRSTALFTALYSLLLMSEGALARPNVHGLRDRGLTAKDGHLQGRAAQVATAAPPAPTDCEQNNLAARQGGGRFGGGRFGRGGFGGRLGGKGNGGNGAVVSSSAPPSTSSAGVTGSGKGNGQGSNGTGNNGQGNNGNGNNGNGNNGQGNKVQGNSGQNNNGQANNGQNNNGQGNNGQNNNNGAGTAPVAANENGQPGPSVPQLQINGGLTLDRSLLLNNVAGGNATAGEAQSAVTNNNFISFCEGKTLTDGLQVQGGSCAVTPLGDIPSTANMVSTFFTSPKNGEQLQAGKTFTISLAVQGMVLGSFTNAKTTYYKAPQQLSGGKIVGHAHVTVQKMQSADSTGILQPGVFAFFKGLDFGDVNGISSVDVQGGLTAGAYRICTIMSNSNHASVIMPVAQRGAENTCSYFTVA